VKVHWTFVSKLVDKQFNEIDPKIEEGLETLKDLLWERVLEKGLVETTIIDTIVDDLKRVKLELDLNVLSDEDLEDIIIESQTDMVKILRLLEE
jgi:hypothetical protein